MNKNNNKKTIYCIYGIIVLVLMVANVTTFGVTKTRQPTDTDREWELFKEFERGFDTAKDRLAEKRYEEEGAEIVSWTKETVLPSPDNAALLYYQAFLLRPKPDAATGRLIDEVLRGAEPDKKIRIYLGHCRNTIHLIELASQIPQCTWGIWHPDGKGSGVGNIHGPLRNLVEILSLDARTLAADGHYRAAFARCLVIRRLSRHVGDDTVLLYAVSKQYDSIAQRTIQHILSVMPSEVDILTWLRGQLAAGQSTLPSFAKTLQTDFESLLNAMRTNALLLGNVRSQLVERTDNEKERKKAQNLTDEELLARAREPYSKFLNSVLCVIDSEMLYEQKYAEIQRLTNKLKKEYGNDPVAGHVILWSGADGGQIADGYGIQVRDTACFNALKAAIEIYYVKAKTGQLPEKLPDYLPKDPYTGKDFDYEITEDGFVLHCKGEDLYQRLGRRLEFKVKK